MATWPPPRRGAEKPTYRVFIGGSKLNDEYKLVGTRHYKYTSKRRSAKVINSIEQALLKAIDSNEISKFNGSIETTPSTKETELDKEGFVKQQKKKVRLHGQQSFYAILYQGELLSLLIQLRFKAYNKYEFDDFGLSRLVVESLLSLSSWEWINTRFENDEAFET